MSHTRRTIWVTGIAALIVGTGFYQARGQQSGPGASKDEAPAVRKTRDASRQVPPFFGQIGLTPEQRESIYAIRAKHLVKIEDLEAEIERVKARMMADCEAVLTPTQKELLNHRREVDTRRRAPASAPGTAPAKGESKAGIP